MRAILLAAMAAVPAVADPALLPGLYTGELPSGVAVELQVESRSADGALSARWRSDHQEWRTLTGAMGEGEEFHLDEGATRVVEAGPDESPGTFRARIVAWPGRRDGEAPDIAKDLAALDAEDPAERDRAERALATTARERQVRDALRAATSPEARARLNRLLTCDVTLVRVATFHHAEWNAGDARFSAASRTLRLPRAEPALRAWAAAVEKDALGRVQAEWLACQEGEEGPESEEDGRGYYEEEWSVELLAPGLVSLRAIVCMDGGGAHPNYAYQTATARLSGDEAEDVALEDWFRPGSGWAPALCALVFDALKEDGAGWIECEEVKSITPDDLSCWTASRDGLHFIFAPYAMGCYAEGTHEVVIPWSALESVLDRDGPVRLIPR